MGLGTGISSLLLSLIRRNFGFQKRDGNLLSRWRTLTFCRM